MRIAIGSDHAGYDQKMRLGACLAEQGHEVQDFGTFDAEQSVDYPDFAVDVGRAVASGSARFGLLVCGTGIGMSITANKVAGVRAANVTTPQFARLAREHNDANVLTLSARFVPVEENERILEAFLGTEFGGERHEKRIAKIHAAEQG